MQHHRPTRTATSLTFTTLVLGFTAILYSWALFVLLPGGMVVIASLPFWLLVVWASSKLVNKQGWHIPVTKWQHWLFWPLVILFVVLAPVYSYWYGYYHTNRLFNGLGIQARMIDVDYQLFDRFGDIGEERYFTIIYQVLEPLDDAEAKLRQRFKNRRDWSIGGSNPNYLYPVLISADCMTPRYFGRISALNFPVAHTGVTIQESGRLGVGFIYEQPRSCTDIR
jgi:hypothetical protein